MDLAGVTEAPAMYKALLNPITCAMITIAVIIGVATGWRRKP